MALAKYVYCLQALEENHEGSEKEFDLEESKEENNIADKKQGFIKESLLKHASKLLPQFQFLAKECHIQLANSFNISPPVKESSI